MKIQRIETETLAWQVTVAVNNALGPWIDSQERKGSSRTMIYHGIEAALILLLAKTYDCLWLSGDLTVAELSERFCEVIGREIRVILEEAGNTNGDQPKS